MPKNGYNYDVFISYPHGENDEDIRWWVTDIFLDYFRQCLMNSTLGRWPEVYIDEDVNKPGDKWRSILADAIARTRILIPIWSVNYFRSEYCRGELAAMLHREKKLGYWDQGHKGSLILPIQLWDGVAFPKIAHEFHQLSCDEFSSARKGTDLHDKLRQVIKDWVPDVAKKIADAPEWNPEWLTKEWLDDPMTEFEENRTLWPPNELYCLESMGCDAEEDDEDDE